MPDAAPRKKFVVIGENIHTTRIKLRKGKHVIQTDRGDEVIQFTPDGGDALFLPIPEKFRKTQDFEEGRVKHVKIAVDHAMFGSGEPQELGHAYLRDMVEKQEATGADYLDLNVDEFSLKRAEQVEAMKWLVETIEAVATVPVCVDSSAIEVIEAGLAASRAPVGAPMLNSASLERPEALDVAKGCGAEVVVTAAGGTAMPDGSAERIENAGRMVDIALSKGFGLSQIYVDPLVFPVSVNSEFAKDCLDAIREIRRRYGPEIRITGGFSNVSFGIPLRKHINDVFLRAAVAAGADSGIIDPVMNDPEQAYAPADDSLATQLATDVVTGNDPDCRAYIKAWRRKKICDVVKVLLHHNPSPGLRAHLNTVVPGWVTLDFADPADRDGFRRKLAGAEVLWHVLEPLGRDDIAAAPALKLIQKIGVGVNTIDLDAARDAGVAVSNMPGSNSAAVAETTLMLMLMACRRAVRLDAVTRAGQGWAQPAGFFDHVSEIGGKTVGLVGFGSIPRLLTPVLSAMGARVLFHARRSHTDPVATGVPLNELLSQSDIVSLHVPLTAETHALINRTRLAGMKKGAVLVNTARGELIDEPALADALRSGHLAGAGLDVFAQEPAPPDSVLFQLENVAVLPHVAWNTPETAARSYSVAIENCRNLRDGIPLLNTV